MPSMFDKAIQFANSPQAKHMVQQATVKAQQLANSPKGRQMLRTATEKAQQLASDPKNRAKLEDVLRRFQGGTGGTGSGKTH